MLPGSLNRRDYLHVGGLALGGLSLPGVLAGRARRWLWSSFSSRPDPAQAFTDSTGRPVPILSHGGPIRALL